MASQNREDSLDALQLHLGVTWNAIVTARANAVSKREQLQKALQALDSEDTSIVVFGSLARDELTSGSDIDWTLLIDGMADPQHFDTALQIEEYITEIEKKKPGREGTFGGLTISHDLIHRMGGEDDTNRNTTQRILLLLESRALLRTAAYERVVKNVLSRYAHEDYGLIHSAGPYNVPRFLLNDISRYWRTVAVDFAYKQRKRGDDGWALRAAKLRISRKLTYVAGLLMCFSCQMDDLTPVADDQESTSTVHPIVDHLLKYSQKTPLEILATLFIRNPQLDPIALELLTTYDKFLSLLDDPEKRQHLNDLSREEVAQDEIYTYVREELGHRFQKSLTELFLSENGTALYELTKTYGVF